MKKVWIQYKDRAFVGGLRKMTIANVLSYYLPKPLDNEDTWFIVNQEGGRCFYVKLSEIVSIEIEE